MASALSGLMTFLTLENTGSVQKCRIVWLKDFFGHDLQAFGNQEVTKQSEKMLSLMKVICYGRYNRFFHLPITDFS